MEVHHLLKAPLCDLNIISGGISSLVLELDDSAVVKVPGGFDRNKEELVVERTIYNRLGPHPYITKYLYEYNGKTVLERLQYPIRKRLWDLRDVGARPPAKDVLRWATQISQALHHAHSRHVFQVDIGPHNVLLDWSENAKLSDFAGASIDGSKPTVLPSPHSEHPDMPGQNPSIQTEMFALGSMLYEIETTRQPYHDKSDEDIEDLFRAGEFPDTSGLILGAVISKLWRMGYEDVGEAMEDMKRIQRKYVNTVENRSGRFWWKERYDIPLSYYYHMANNRIALLLFQSVSLFLVLFSSVIIESRCWDGFIGRDVLSIGRTSTNT